MRTGSFIVGLLLTRENRRSRRVIVGIVQLLYNYCCPAQACLAEVEARVSGFCYQILYLGSLCRRYVRGPWGRIKGRLEDPSGLGSAWIASLDVSLTAGTVGGFAGMGWMVVF